MRIWYICIIYFVICPIIFGINESLSPFFTSFFRFLDSQYLISALRRNIKHANTWTIGKAMSLTIMKYWLELCLGHQPNSSWTIFNALIKPDYWLFFLSFILAFSVCIFSSDWLYAGNFQNDHKTYWCQPNNKVLMLLNHTEWRACVLI